MATLRRDAPTSRGQTLVETALVLPIFLMVVMGIIVFAIGLFYQQQIANAAREGARYAAVRSASADCPMGGWLQPRYPSPSGAGAWNCERQPWAGMTARARERIFGLPTSAVQFAACWSGYVDKVTGFHDAGPVVAGGDPNKPADRNPWTDCSMAGISPISSPGSLPCPVVTRSGDDRASNLAVSPSLTGAEAANRVVVYACYRWTPPMAGFLGIPGQITFRAVASEGLQHQR